MMTCPLPHDVPAQALAPTRWVDEALLRDLLVESGDSILLLDQRLAILAANKRAAEVHGLEQGQLIGRDCRLLLAQADRPVFEKALISLKNYKNWIYELRAVRGETEVFSLDITVKRFPAPAGPLYLAVLRDLGPIKRLQDLLSQERNHRREMYITLRNLMKAFEKEKKSIEGGIAHKIETVLLPALEKIRTETDAEIRTSFLNFMREQLIGLTKGFSKELDGRFLRLTRTEMRVCHLIQEGHSAKEIAGLMNLSLETVQTHRRNIRKKLGLSRRKVNLQVYLSTKPLFQKMAAR